MITVSADSPISEDSMILIGELSEILSGITGDSGRSSFDPEDVLGPRARFVVARNESGHLLGCGAFRPLDEETAELKRMYTRASTSLVGVAILTHLEAEAAKLGYRQLWLETRLVNERAVRFYERNGYKRRSNFGKYVGNDKAVCFEKTLLKTDRPPVPTLGD